jgi:hypothetical protein
VGEIICQLSATTPWRLPCRSKTVSGSMKCAQMSTVASAVKFHGLMSSGL